MARATSFLLLASCMVVAAAMLGSVANATSYEFTEQTLEFYIHYEAGSKVFGLPNEDPEVSKFGRGALYDNKVTLEADKRSAEIGRSPGMYYYASRQDKSNQQIFSVVFNENSPFGESTLNLEGAWSGKYDHEVAIMGGTGGFRYSFGTAFFHTTEENLFSFKVVATIFTLKPSKIAGF